MDIQAYIESGVLELYVSGALTPQEMQEVERMAQAYPEVKNELDAIENSFFEMANDLHSGPRASLKDELLRNVKLSVSAGINQSASNIPNANTSAPSIEQKEAKVIGMEAKPANKSFKFAFAASIALFIASSAALVVVWGNWKSDQQKLVDLQLRFDESTTQIAALKASYDSSEDMIASLKAPEVQKLKLAGLPISPESQAMVHWDKNTKKVILDPMNLPRTDEGHDYQLWAIVDGKPVDLGVFSPGDNELNIYTMKSVEAPQAFAITLEPKGGSVNPTMEQMYVIGKI